MYFKTKLLPLHAQWFLLVNSPLALASVLRAGVCCRGVKRWLTRLSACVPPLLPVQGARRGVVDPAAL